MDSDPEVHMRVARDFLRFQLGINADDRFTLSLARAMLHYAVHQLFLEPGEALSKIGKISSIPAIIIQGTEDKVCLPGQALLLHQNWSNSRLWLIDGGGHSPDDPLIAEALIRATGLLFEELK